MRHASSTYETNLIITHHARQRMSQRNVSLAAIERVVAYGRVEHGRDAELYAIGKKEVARYRREGIDLAEVEGILVVCADNRIVTTYRDRELRTIRSARPRREARRRQRRLRAQP